MGQDRRSLHIYDEPDVTAIARHQKFPNHHRQLQSPYNPQRVHSIPYGPERTKSGIYSNIFKADRPSFDASMQLPFMETSIRNKKTTHYEKNSFTTDYAGISNLSTERTRSG